jgi:hypothetical protein
MLVNDDIEIKHNSANKIYASMALFALRYYIETLQMCFNAVDSEYHWLDRFLIDRYYTVDQGLQLIKIRKRYLNQLIYLKKVRAWLNEYVY